MLYTLFFSQLRDLDADGAAHYGRVSGELHARARAQHPGFVDMKTYVAEDGERLTVVRFKDADDQAAWKKDEVHHEGQALARTHFYEWFRIVVAEQLRERSWTREDDEREGT